jgi:spore cortex formation protein SpoVR/YcgB (stage V sporulation)
VAHPAQARGAEETKVAKRFPPEPQENLLYFIEKNAPLLEPWQREIVRIVRKIAVLLPAAPDPGDERGLGHLLALHHPQPALRRGLVSDGFMMEFLQATPTWSTSRLQQPYYSGLNPYALGFADVPGHPPHLREPRPKTTAGRPTSPAATGETLDFAMRNFKDESFLCSSCRRA